MIHELDRELVYNDELTAKTWALNSAVECHPHTVEVIGSNPIAPTINYLKMWDLPFRASPQMSNLCCLLFPRQNHPHNTAMGCTFLFADGLGVDIHCGANVGVPVH